MHHRENNREYTKARRIRRAKLLILMEPPVGFEPTTFRLRTERPYIKTHDVILAMLCVNIVSTPFMELTALSIYFILVQRFSSFPHISKWEMRWERYGRDQNISFQTWNQIENGQTPRRFKQGIQDQTRMGIPHSLR